MVILLYQLKSWLLSKITDFVFSAESSSLEVLLFVPVPGFIDSLCDGLCAEGDVSTCVWCLAMLLW